MKDVTDIAKSGRRALWQCNMARLLQSALAGLVMIVIFLLTGCTSSQSVDPLDQINYSAHLAEAVCFAVEQVNRAGKLTDESTFAEEFETAVQDYVRQQEIDENAWLAAKKKYFTPEEHERMIKMHFTRCLIGL